MIRTTKGPRQIKRMASQAPLFLLKDYPNGKMSRNKWRDQEILCSQMQVPLRVQWNLFWPPLLYFHLFQFLFLFLPFSLLWPLLQETILIALSRHSVRPAFLPLLHCLTLRFSMTPNSKTQIGSCHLRLLICFSRDMLNSCWCCWELFISGGLRNHSLKA